MKNLIQNVFLLFLSVGILAAITWFFCHEANVEKWIGRDVKIKTMNNVPGTVTEAYGSHFKVRLRDGRVLELKQFEVTE